MYETKRSPDRYHLLYEGWSSHKIRFFLARTHVINNILINCVVHTVNSCFEETLLTVMDNPMIRIADNFHYKLVRYEIEFRWTLDMDTILQSQGRPHRWSRQLYFPRKILHQKRLNLVVEGNIKVIWS